MFHRFTNALFGEDVEELNQRSRTEDEKEDEDEDWILVNYLAEACSSRHGDALSGSTICPEDDDDDDGEDLVMIPSPTASPAIRYPSCTSLNSTADTDPDGAAEEEEDVDGEEEGFLRLDASSLEESWFVTPPPCFTGCGSKPVFLETSPLENLLIEHPSMSVYAHHSPSRLTLEPLPRRSLDRDLEFLSGNVGAELGGGKEKGRGLLDGPRHRPDVVQRRSNHHSSCYAAALSAQARVLPQRAGNTTQRAQPLSRKALRRLNLLRPPKTGTTQLHQPSQRHLNF